MKIIACILVEWLLVQLYLFNCMKETEKNTHTQNEELYFLHITVFFQQSGEMKTVEDAVSWVTFQPHRKNEMTVLIGIWPNI